MKSIFLNKKVFLFFSIIAILLLMNLLLPSLKDCWNFAILIVFIAIYILSMIAEEKKVCLPTGEQKSYEIIPIENRTTVSVKEMVKILKKYSFSSKEEVEDIIKKDPSVINLSFYTTYFYIKDKLHSISYTNTRENFFIEEIEENAVPYGKVWSVNFLLKK